MIPAKLFRGDKINNGTLAEKYRSAGLLTKSINGGNPAYIQRAGLLSAIRGHVKPSNIDEEIFQKKSLFFSFSSNRDVALYYASDRKPNDLLHCEPYREHRYLFTFTSLSCNVRNCDKGIFLLTYEHDLTLEDGDSTFDKSVMTQRMESGFARCEICENGNLHQLVLIDVVSFLKTHPKCGINEQALSNAKRDFEWLIMPADYHARLHGNSACLPRSRSWGAEHFRLRSETLRNPEMFSIPGMDITDV